MSNHIIQSLWVGPRLSPMEQLSIASFLRHGHEFHLYTYEEVAGVPPGTVIKDANEIIPASVRNYRDFPKLAIFADFFRYKLLLEKGGWWVDTDTVCVKPFDLPQDYAFSSEVMALGGGRTIIGTQVNNGNIKAPVGSPIMAALWNRCLEMNYKNIEWGASGPTLMEAHVEQFGLRSFVQPPQVFCPVMAWEVRKLVNNDVVFAIPQEAYAVHLWNEMWGRAELDKNATYPPGCAYEQLKRRFLRTNPPNVIQSLWVGDRLSTMERLSLSSYLYYGEEFHLYTYGPCEGIPEGTKILDANEIVPFSDIEKFQNLANFSDWFRYNLLFKKGGWWVDTDTVCLRPFDIQDDYFFVNQYGDSGHKDQINGDYLKSPVGGPVMQWLIEQCQAMDWKTIEWSDIGPNLVTSAVRRFFLPVHPSHVSFNPPALTFIGAPVKIGPEAMAVHLVRNNWCGKWALGKHLDRDATYPPDCLYEQFKRAYLPPGAQLGAPWLQDYTKIAPVAQATEKTAFARPAPAKSPSWPKIKADPDWRKKIIGDKVNRALAKGYKVVAICPMGSAYHLEMRRIMPKAIEELIDTPEGHKVLMLIK